jgi:flagellar biosynthesis/type III secretory pathway protein FliH
VTYVWDKLPRFISPRLIFYGVPPVSDKEAVRVKHPTGGELYDSAAQRAADAILKAWKGVVGKKDTEQAGESSEKSHDYCAGYSAGYADSSKQWQASGEAWIKAAGEARRNGLERGRKEGYEEGVAAATRKDAEHIASITRDRQTFKAQLDGHAAELAKEKEKSFDAGWRQGKASSEWLGRDAFKEGFEAGKRETIFLHKGESSRAQLLDFMNTCTRIRRSSPSSRNCPGSRSRSGSPTRQCGRWRTRRNRRNLTTIWPQKITTKR